MELVTVTRDGLVMAVVCQHVPITAAIRRVPVSHSSPAYVMITTVVCFPVIYTVFCCGLLLFTGPVILRSLTFILFLLVCHHGGYSIKYEMYYGPGRRPLAYLLYYMLR